MIPNHAGQLSSGFGGGRPLRSVTRLTDLRTRLAFPFLVLALLIPTIVSYHTGRHRLNAILGFAVDGVLTVGLIVSVTLLVDALPTGKEAPQQLLLSAASLWITNILVFALWYWRLDAGGPYQRDKLPGHSDGSLPLSADDNEQRGSESSRPAGLVT